MKPMAEFEIGIIGKGKMGTNLFFYFLDFDFPIKWICRNAKDIPYLTKKVQNKLSRSVKLGVMDRNRYQKRLEKIQISHRLDDLKNCRLVIETVTEEIQVKQLLFRELDRLVSEDCILTSNSSSILPGEWYRGGERPERIAGLHFFYPVSVKNIVELITTNLTGKEVVETICHFLSYINCKSLVLTEESAFLLNRLFLDFQAGAFHVLKEYHLSLRTLDNLIKEEFFPVGVFEFFDHVGIDVMYNSIRRYSSRLKNRDFYQPMIHQLNELIQQKRLGVKTQHGFYSYQDKPSDQVTDSHRERLSSAEKKSIIRRLKKWYLDTAILFTLKGYCTRDEMDNAVKEYMSCEKGPFELSEK